MTLRVTKLAKDVATVTDVGEGEMALTYFAHYIIANVSADETWDVGYATPGCVPSRMEPGSILEFRAAFPRLLASRVDKGAP